MQLEGIVVAVAAGSFLLSMFVLLPLESRLRRYPNTSMLWLGVPFFTRTYAIAYEEVCERALSNPSLAFSAVDKGTGVILDRGIRAIIRNGGHPNEVSISGLFPLALVVPVIAIPSALILLAVVEAARGEIDAVQVVLATVVMGGLAIGFLAIYGKASRIEMNEILGELNLTGSGVIDG